MGKQPVLDWHGIKAELHRRGMTLTGLGRMSGLDPSACRRVNTSTNYAAQAAIAEFIGQKPEDLWPDRYPKGKTRILDTTKYPTAPDRKSVV